MTASKRTRLGTVVAGRVEHPGLALDRYLEQIGDKHEAAKQLYDVVCTAGPSVVYQRAFARWRQTLDALGVVMLKGKPSGEADLAKAFGLMDEFAVRSRLIVGLGSESVRETGITLHHSYGLPLIPGSSLKGLLARYVEKTVPKISQEQRKANPTEMGLTKQERETLTGTTDAAGIVTFFDAWYVPDPPEASPFRRDVITVHHPTYYASRGGKRAPWDFDDPNPVPYVTATGRYLVAVRSPEAPGWAAIAFALLERALADWGVGAKTSSGYGRLDRYVPAAPPDPLLEDIAALPVDRVREQPEILQQLFYERCRAAQPTMQRDAARAILAKLAAAGISRDLGRWHTVVKAWAQRQV